jgi:very-short-patch-repair endonuclease
MEKNKKLTPIARNLRKNQTKEEALLWYRFLRTYKPRFHRQYVIGNYIADFYCHKAKLVVELDGSQHYEPEVALQDAKRTAYFETIGLQVLRFTNLDVLQRFSAVCETINDFCQGR